MLSRRAIDVRPETSAEVRATSAVVPRSVTRAQALAIALAALLAGCSDSADVTPSAAGFRRDFREQLFESALSLLNGRDRFEQSDALAQVVNRWNQWSDADALNTPTTTASEFDSRLASLPKPLRTSPPAQSLQSARYRLDDAYAVQEAIWLREIGRHAVGRELDAIARAELLFDWTIRNLALDEPAEAAESEPAVLRRPWQIFLLGRATAAERAWLFVLLLRQQDLDAVLLTSAAHDPGSAPLVAVMIDDELYLFDPLWGIPLPRADGPGVATLAAARQEPQVLGQLHVDGEPAYRWTAEQLQNPQVCIEAGPVYLAERIARIESRLAGPQRLVLSVDVEAIRAALKASHGLDDARLWPLPWERWQPLSNAERARVQAQLRPFFAMKDDVLGRARVAHALGRWMGERGAIERYMQARPEDALLSEMHDRGRLTPDVERDLRAGKVAAAYWLGLVSYERGNFEAAIDFLERRTLAIDPQGPWVNAARFQLALTYAALGRSDEARSAYRTTTGAQRPGNLLRARRLASSPAK